MMRTEIRELTFPSQRPEDIFRLLEHNVTLAQNRLPSAHVLILASRQEQASSLAQFLLAGGYTSLIASNGLEAYTLFLRGTLAPMLIFATQEALPDRFFLQRLVQQMRQQYGWEPPLVRLPAALIALLMPQTTEPLSAMARFSPQTTTPLSLEQGGEQAGVVEQKISLEEHNLGRYQVHSLLGDGSWGAVYTAYDRLRERDVALKAIQTDAFAYFSQEENLFQQEEKLLEGVKHPHILPLYTIGKSYVSGSPFMFKAMPLCVDGSLANWLAEHVHTQGYDPQEVLALVLPLADALHLMHERNVTHNNFKLTNLLISGKPDQLASLQLLLADFLPHPENRFLARTPENFPFMAPEQWQGESFAASDQYALAVLIYRLLTGRFPFLGETEQLLQQMHLSAQPQPLHRFNPAVSPALNAVVLSALVKNPQERFPSLAEFARALRYVSGL